MGRELKIEGRVYDLTADLARRLGKSEAEVVEQALRDLRDRLAEADESAAEAERSAFRERIRALQEQVRREIPPGTTSDHSFLYDENGLPR
jgi:hypothetical protein